MNTIEAINKRLSYRGKYAHEKIPREHLIQIMQGGLAAPSGCNKQTTSMIAVDDPIILNKLHEIIQPPIGETAPAMICVLTRKIVAYSDKSFSMQDNNPDTFFAEYSLELNLFKRLKMGIL